MQKNKIKPEARDLTERHPDLIHMDNQRVDTHTQRTTGDWVTHTLMLEGRDVPFKFRRKKPYKSLRGARVNLTYYASSEQVAGLHFDVMNVVRIKRI